MSAMGPTVTTWSIPNSCTCWPRNAQGSQPQPLADPSCPIGRRNEYGSGLVGGWSAWACGSPRTHSTNRNVSSFSGVIRAPSEFWFSSRVSSAGR